MCGNPKSSTSAVLAHPTPDSLYLKPSVSSPQLSPEQSTLAWIQYQRFSRRAESLQSSRKVFMRARKAAGSLWHVFAASALMEWHAAKNETVRAPRKYRG